MDEKLQLRNMPPEIDHLMLVHLAGSVSSPQKKIGRWLRDGTVTSLRRGLYLVNPPWQSRPVSKEILANRLYSPSYVSLEYALAYYGLIPEAVRQLTSVTTGKHKVFETSLGVFNYEHLTPARYAFGYRREALADGTGYLIAAPEKALLDKLYRVGEVRSRVQLEAVLFEDLRIDEMRLASLDQPALISGAAAYNTRTFTKILIPWLESRHDRRIA